MANCMPTTAGSSPNLLTVSVQGVRPSGLERVLDRDLAEFINVCISPRNERPRSRQLLKHPYFETIRREKGVCRFREEALAGAPHRLLLLYSARQRQTAQDLASLLRAVPGCTELPIWGSGMDVLHVDGCCCTVPCTSEQCLYKLALGSASPTLACICKQSTSVSRTSSASTNSMTHSL